MKPSLESDASPSNAASVMNPSSGKYAAAETKAGVVSHDRPSGELTPLLPWITHNLLSHHFPNQRMA
jgi:hypothetical protein